MYNNTKRRLSPTHKPDIVKGPGRPRPATVGLPVDEVHSPPTTRHGASVTAAKPPTSC